MTKQECGRIGGNVVAGTKGREYYQEIGAIGGIKTALKHGTEHMARIGRKGGNAAKKTKQEGSADCHSNVSAGVQ